MMQPHPVQEYYRIQARRRALLTIVMVFLAVATAVWSGLARRGSSNINLAAEPADSAIEDAANQKDDPFSKPPGTARLDSTSAGAIGPNGAIGQAGSSSAGDIGPAGAERSTLEASPNSRPSNSD